MTKQKWRTKVVVAGFCLFTLITTFTNKYVLSVQKFTYPTIFQSWQSGTLALVLLSLHALGYTELTLASRACLMGQLPAIGLFTGIIYCGSVALSKLPVPVFCVLHYLTFVLIFLFELILFKKTASFIEGISLALVVTAAVFTRENDPQFNRQGYLWMMGHCVFIALYTLCDDKIPKPNNMSEVNKMFYNAFGSLILLMTVSVFTGELYSALDFPSLYSRQFHTGCIGSGVFGSVLAVLRYSVTTSELASSLCTVESANKVLLSISSLAFFSASYTVNMAASILVALCSGLVYSCVFARTDPNQKSEKYIRFATAKI